MKQKTVQKETVPSVADASGDLKKCALCKQDLIPTKEIGYLHPPSEDGNYCKEWDGCMIDQDARYEWDKKYGKPNLSYSELNTLLGYEINMTCDLHQSIETAKEELRKCQKENKYLNESVTKLKSELKHHQRPIWKRLLETKTL